MSLVRSTIERGHLYRDYSWAQFLFNSSDFLSGLRYCWPAIEEPEDTGLLPSSVAYIPCTTDAADSLSKYVQWAHNGLCVHGQSDINKHFEWSCNVPWIFVYSSLTRARRPAGLLVCSLASGGNPYINYDAAVYMDACTVYLLGRGVFNVGLEGGGLKARLRTEA